MRSPTGAPADDAAAAATRDERAAPRQGLPPFGDLVCLRKKFGETTTRVYRLEHELEPPLRCSPGLLANFLDPPAPSPEVEVLVIEYPNDLLLLVSLKLAEESCLVYDLG